MVASDPTYDFHRAAGLLAHAYANTGQPEQADALFQQVTKISTSSETYYNYACFLASQQRNAEARRVGPANSGKEAQHAGIFAPPRTALVPQSQCAAEPSAG